MNCIEIPKSVYTDSKEEHRPTSFHSDVSLITSSRKQKHKRSYLKNQKFWKVYVPSFVVVLVLLSLVVAYSIHSIIKATAPPEPKKETIEPQSPSAKNEIKRRFDSPDGLLKRNSPLNSIEIGVYNTCETMLEELDPVEFLHSQCRICDKDFGIVSARVMNLCVVGSLLQPMNNIVCSWDGIECNQNGDITTLSIKTTSSIDFITPNLIYLTELSSLSISAVPSKPSRNTLPMELFTLLHLKQLELVGVDVRVEFPIQEPITQLTLLRFDSIRSFGILPEWLSNQPMEYFSLSRVTIGVPPLWFQGSLWTTTIKSFELIECRLSLVPEFVFPTTTNVIIQ
jgi:hypothetical protein